MFKIIKNTIFGVLVIIAPILLIFLLEIKIALFPLLIFSICTYLIFLYLEEGYKKLIISLIILAFFFFKLLLIPYTYYLIWFEQILTSVPNGIVSTNLVYIICFFWAFYISYLSKDLDINNVLYISNFILFLGIIINPNRFTVITFILITLIIILKNTYMEKAYYKIIPIILIIISLSLISFPINTFIKADKSSWHIDEVAHGFRKTISILFPNYDLLSPIPGVSSDLKDSRGKPPILTSNKLFKLKGRPEDEYYLRMNVSNKKSDKIIENIRQYKKINRLKSLKIFIEAEYIPVIPTTINTVKSNNYNINNKLNSTLRLKEPLQNGDIIFLEMGENFNLEPDFKLKTGPVDKEISDLAKSLKGNTNRETINNIRNFLEKEFEYSLETKESKSYIKDFLFTTKKGFCIHFARSFILLARLNNITCREVSGYYVKVPRKPSSYLMKYGEVYVTGKDAHMWPEIFIDNRWETFEVTPGIYKEIDIIENNIKVKDTNIKTEYNDNIEYKWVYIIITLLIIIILLIIFVKKRENIFGKIIKKSISKGIPHPKDIGWVDWNRIVIGNDYYLKIILDACYNNKIIKKEDKIILKRLLKLIGK